MHLILHTPLYVLVVQRVLYEAIYLDYDRFIHLVAYDNAGLLTSMSTLTHDSL
ncbi:protein of unknown function [Trichlorobacter ammonificans]|uniref:Uncharacterized protein n=1 Tax=Trichlorobacter ammonificans TaxID=2916410 RepID=A0ABN8HG80_9BACT|nr:protein of unknown function [Trichlorobacter ammonificans]